ncbi:MAG TPA: hypothetical protein VHC22_33120 [Pirellulales bacterium]|nr:hypothetical protein [Pirellulales bacterium]
MEENQNRTKRGATSVALVLATMLILYVLSIGPAVALVGATGTRRDPVWFTVFQCIYGPLALAPRPLHGPIDWWIELWDFYGEFH